MRKSNAERQKEYRQRHPDNRREKHRLLKHEVLTHYGNGKLACVKCGFVNIDALSIDHLAGDGAEQRRSLERKSSSHGTWIYLWLKKHDYPKGYQTLCMNCQWIKRKEKGEFARPEDRHKYTLEEIIW